MFFLLVFLYFYRSAEAELKKIECFNCILLLLRDLRVILVMVISRSQSAAARMVGNAADV